MVTKSSALEEVKVTVRSFLQTTTVHGLNQVARPGRAAWWRATWLVLTLAAAAYTTWQLHGLVARFLARPIEVITTTTFEPVPFPSITFCNLNQLRKSQLSLGGQELVGAVEGIAKAQYESATGGSRVEVEEVQGPRVKRQAAAIPDCIDVGNVANWPFAEGVYLKNDSLTDCAIGTEYEGRPRYESLSHPGNYVWQASNFGMWYGTSVLCKKTDTETQFYSPYPYAPASPDVIQSGTWRMVRSDRYGADQHQSLTVTTCTAEATTFIVTTIQAEATTRSVQSTSNEETTANAAATTIKGEATTNAETTIVNAETTAVNDEATIINGETTASNAETTAVNGDTKAVNGETIAGKGETTAVNGETTAGKGETTAVNGETTAVNGETTAVNAETTAGNAETTAVNGETTAVNGEITAGNAETTAVNSETTAVNADTTTTYAEATTVNTETKTTDDETTAINAETTTVNAETKTSDTETTTVNTATTANAEEITASAKVATTIGDLIIATAESTAVNVETTEQSGPYDPADEQFLPEVNLTNKPWFALDKETPSISVQTKKNLSRALSAVDAGVQATMGHVLDDMLVSCTWKGNRCTSRHFSHTLNPVYGNCFTFNADANESLMLVHKAGPHYGLSLLLHVEQAEYVAALSPVAGVRLAVTAPGHQPFPEDGGGGVDLSPGTSTDVRLRLVDHSLYEPFRNCTREPEATLYKYYSTKACQKSCLQLEKLARCGCADPALPIPQGARICEDEDDFCSTRTDERILSNVSQCACPQLCREKVFGFTAVKTAWPSESHQSIVEDQIRTYGKKFKDIICQPGGLRRNFLQVHVYYDEVKRQEAKEHPAYLVASLLADVGGVAGLWVGVSAVSLAEVVQLLAVLVHTLLTAGSTRRRTTVGASHVENPVAHPKRRHLRAGMSTSGDVTIEDLEETVTTARAVIVVTEGGEERGERRRKQLHMERL